jgi:hypothetical protein
LAQLILRAATIVCLLIAARGTRWAYLLFVLLALISFPARAGFQIVQPSCELFVVPQLAAYSFRNYPHIVLFALFALLSLAQFKGSHAYLWAFLATLVMGVLVELAEGVSGQGHCRMRDILPNTAGAILGLLIFEVGRRAWQVRFEARPNTR